MASTPIDWTSLTEESELTGPSLNTRFSSLKGEINDLPVVSVQPNSLNDKHLESIVAVSASQACGANSHNYRNHYPGWNSDTANVFYGSGGRPRGNGWNVIEDQGGTDLRVSHKLIPTSTSDDNFVYIVMANINMRDLRHKTKIVANAVRTSGFAGYTPFQYGVFKVQVTQDNSAWYGVPVSERYASAETEQGREGCRSGSFDSGTDAKNNVQVWKDIPIRLMLTRAELINLGLTAGIKGARIVTSVVEPDGSTDTIKLVLGRCNLSVFALYCSSTET